MSGRNVSITGRPVSVGFIRMRQRPVVHGAISISPPVRPRPHDWTSSCLSDAPGRKERASTQGREYSLSAGDNLVLRVRAGINRNQIICFSFH